MLPLALRLGLSFFLISVYVILNQVDYSSFSLVGSVMSLGGWVASVFAVILALFLFVPFFFTIDSERKIFYLRWFLFDFSIDLSTKTAVIGFAGFHPAKKKKKVSLSSSAAPSPAPAEEPEKKRGGRSIPSVILSHRSLLIDLVKKTVRYLLDLLRATSIREFRVDYSSKDPVVNGICYGAIQGVQIKKVRLSVNFWGENRMVGKFSLMLVRLVVPTLLFLVRLPYVELYRLFKEIRQKDFPGGVEGASTPS